MSGSNAPQPRTLRRAAAAALFATALAGLAPAAPVLAQGLPLGSVARVRENVTIDRIEIALPNGSLTLSGLSAVGSSLSRGEIEALLRSTSVVGLADRLARFDAERLSIAKFEWRMKSDAGESLTTYEGIEARGIKAGVIEETVIRGASGTSTVKPAGADKPIETTMRLARMAQATIDLAGIFRWYTEADPTGRAPMKTLFGRYEADSMEIKSADFTANFGRLSGSGMKLRLPRQPVMTMIRDLEAGGAKPKDKAAELGVIATIIDLYQSFEFGDFAVDGMRFAGKDSKTGKDVTGRIGKIGFNGGARATGTVNDLDIVAADGFFRLARLGFEGDFYGVMFMAAAKAMEGDAAKLGTPEAAAAIGRAQAALAGYKPGDIGLRVEGLDGDFPPAAGAKSPDRVKLRLERFEMLTGAFVGFMPTKLDYSLSRFSMPMPNDSSDKGLQTLRDLGLTQIELSARIKASWEEARQRFHFEDISADLGRFGRVSLKGELAGIAKPLFENPQTNWPMVMGTGSVQSLGINIENQGGVDALIAMTAKQQGAPADQMRFQLSAYAPALVAGLMPGHPDATKLADALTRFIRQPGSLVVTARAASPAGLTVPELMGAAGNPAALLEKVRIEAEAR